MAVALVELMLPSKGRRDLWDQKVLAENRAQKGNKVLWGLVESKEIPAVPVLSDPADQEIYARHFDRSLIRKLSL